MQIITAYANYLSERGLSEGVCTMYGLSWTTDGRLQIPIKDKFGGQLFNKYRRNPYLTTGPKYTYDYGAKAALFGVDKLPPKYVVSTVIICEGELDAMLITDKLHTFGIIGLSSTGGCGTWNEEWNEYLKNTKVYILYDSDIPGVMGAIKVHKKIPDSHVIFLPQNIRLHPKDITELYQKLKDDEKFIKAVRDMTGDRHIIDIPFEAVLEKEKTELQWYWVNRLRSLNQEKKDNYWAKIILEHVNKLDSYKAISKKKAVTGGEDLTVAKSHKITDFVRFKQNKAKCIWHKDDSPSLTYYPANNTVYCFGCQKAGDAVDVYMQVHNVSFKEAIKALNTS